MFAVATPFFLSKYTTNLTIRFVMNPTASAILWGETFFRKLFFWTKNETELGGAIRWFHSICFFSLILLYILLQLKLISDTSWIFWAFYLLYCLIWIHHIVCQGCLITFIEDKLLLCNNNRGEGGGNSLPHMISPIFSLFGIPCDDPALGNRIFLFVSTLIFIQFNLQALSHFFRAKVDTSTYV